MIIKRKVKGITYIYERTYSEGKRHEKVIGKVDKDGNEVYYDTTAERCISGGKGWGCDGEDISTHEELSHELVHIKTSDISKMLLDLSKISQKAFDFDANIALYQEMPARLAMERRGSSREITTLATINFDSDGMKEKGLTIRGTEKLTQFDRIVLDAINSLFIEGQNQFITTQMIFHVITGDTNRRITPNYAQEINNSLTKLLFSHITIKANEEAIMYPKLKDFEYHDTIVPGNMVKAILNGTEVACIQVDREPPLYVYAKYKNQIGFIR